MAARLAQEPFNKNYSMVSMDAMAPDDFILLLNEIIHQIDPKQLSPVQCKAEAPEARVVRQLEFLKSVQYKPKEPKGLKTGCLLGEKKHMLPILSYLVCDFERIKERAYLARFLVKINVPPEMVQSDETIGEAWQEYLELIDRFKEIHSSVTEQRQQGPDTESVRADIRSMEEERKQIEKRVEKAEQKAKSTPNFDGLSQAAKRLRLERQKSDEIQMQIREQRTQLTMIDSRLERATQRLESLSSQQAGMSPQYLIERTADELKTANYRKKELLPKTLAELKRQLNALQEAAADPAPDKISLMEKVSLLRDDMAKIEEAKMEESKDHSLIAFRQNANNLTRRKEAQAEILQEKMVEEDELRKEINEKKKMMEKEFGTAPMNEAQFKEYGTELRRQGQRYNAARNQLKQLQSENGVLSRTMEILGHKLIKEKEKLARLEKVHGVTGFAEQQQRLEEISGAKQEKDAEKGKAMEDIAQMVDKLQNKIEEQRETIEPLLNRVRPLRVKHQQLQSALKEAQSKYDSALAGYEVGRAQLEREFGTIRARHTSERAEFHIQRAQLENLHSLQDRLQDADTWRDVLNRKLLESERRSKDLREQQRALREQKNVKKEEEAARWRQVISLLRIKEKLATRVDAEKDDPTLLEENRLVL